MSTFTLNAQVHTADDTVYFSYLLIAGLLLYLAAVSLLLLQYEIWVLFPSPKSIHVKSNKVDFAVMSLHFWLIILLSNYKV